MLYNVAQLLKEPAGAVREYPLDEEVTFSDDPGWGRVRLRGTVSLLRTGPGILVSGVLATSIAEECSRCILPMQQPLELDVEDEFFPVVDMNTGHLVEVPEDGFPIDTHHHLDITEAVRQAIVVSRPIQPLCNPECRGLCPECGVNRNVEPCECETGAADARWATLKALRP
jgi:uncharacterized protein